MISSSKETTWRVICNSVRGAMHIKKGMPNQDAFALKVLNEGDSVIVAVADGHGDPRCFRSEIGSSIAVRAAVDLLEEVAKYSSETSSLSVLKRSLESNFPHRLHSIWKKRVEQDFSVAGFSQLSEDKPEIFFEISSDAVTSLADDSYLAYGTTLLAALITRNLLMFAQIGDGDILVISDSGEVYSPVPDDERLFGNATTSLCSMEASRDFRLFIERLSETPPILVLLSTDGLSNSFASEEEFREVAKSFLDNIKIQGEEYLKTNIESFLNDLSADRIGDDITVGIIFKESILKE